MNKAKRKEDCTKDEWHEGLMHEKGKSKKDYTKEEKYEGWKIREKREKDYTKKEKDEGWMHELGKEDKGLYIGRKLWLIND